MKKTIVASIFLVINLQYVFAYIPEARYYDLFRIDDCFGDYDNNYYSLNVGEDNYEVVYMTPEKIRNIIDFLNKISTPAPAKTHITTTQEPTTTPLEETTPILTTETFPTTSTESITTWRKTTSAEIEDPIEDVINSGPVENDEVTTSKSDIEVPPEPEDIDNGDEFERDSEEDILSIKKPEKIMEPVTPKDENNSKPEDINAWF